MGSQNTAQMRPSAPVTMNDVCQLNVPITQATRGSEMAEPILEPLSKMAAASPRSLLGNQLAATFAMEG